MKDWNYPKLDETKAHVRWVMDGKIYGRPTRDDLLALIKEMEDLADEQTP